MPNFTFLFTIFNQLPLSDGEINRDSAQLPGYFMQ